MSKKTYLTAAFVGALFATSAALAPAFAQDRMKGEKTVMVGGAAMFPSKNIVQNAVNSKDHTTLVAAVKAAGLVDTLQSAGPFTVFAPVNAAFAKLPTGTVETLLKPENKGTLTTVLTYHVVPGRLTAANLMKAVKDGGGQAKFKTVAGGEITVHVAVGRQADDHRRQGRHVDRHHRRRAAVERRHPRRQFGSAPELIWFAPIQTAQEVRAGATRLAFLLVRPHAVTDLLMRDASVAYVRPSVTSVESVPYL